MVGETIGNSGCQCIFPFDKHYLKLGLDKLIEEEDEKIRKVQKKIEEIKKTGLTEPEALIYELEDSTYKRFKRDVETVKKRLENTPDCDRHIILRGK